MRLSYTYEDRNLLVCECGHGGPRDRPPQRRPRKRQAVRDANGNPLADGDDVIVIRTSSSGLLAGGQGRHQGARHPVDGDHDIDCRIDGIGPMQLKSEFVRKA